jgi:hypothetical protein
MLDVGGRDVSVAGTAMVDPRTAHSQDLIATVIERSPEVATFINR